MYPNMPGPHRPRKRNGKQVVGFVTSPATSLYLLHLTVGDRAHLTQGGGRRDRYRHAQGRRGARTRRPRCRRRDPARVTDSPAMAAPPPQLDMIAVPGTSQFFGAMENCGRHHVLRAGAADGTRRSRRKPTGSNIYDAVADERRTPAGRQPGHDGMVGRPLAEPGLRHPGRRRRPHRRCDRNRTCRCSR